MLHRRVDELLDLREADDLGELPLDFGLAHAEDGAVEKNVLAAGEVGMKTGADLEQRSHAAVNVGFAFSGRGDP